MTTWSTWSRTSIFNSWPARITSRVTFISLSDGVGSPDGWLCAPLRPSVPLPLADAQTEARRRTVHVKYLRRVAAPHPFRTGLSRPLAHGSKLQCRDARTGARIGSVMLNPQTIECRRRSIDVIADLPPCLAAMEAALRNSAA